MDDVRQRINQLKEQLIAKMETAPRPTYPDDFMNDPRLEEAFKEPETDENGYSDSLPSIWFSTLPEMEEAEILYITPDLAMTESNLYSQYLDEKAIIWDAIRKEYFFYKPNPGHPQMAFKGEMGAWIAKKLKPEYADQLLEDI